jgi:hypothetical protein
VNSEIKNIFLFHKGVTVVKVNGKDREVDIITLQDLDKFKDLILAYPELSKVRKLLEIKQGVILISGSKTVEATLNLFTSLLRMEMITAWRDAYEMVDVNELLEDAQLIALPAMWEMPIASVVMGSQVLPVGVRKVYIALSSPDVYGIIFFCQPSVALLVNDKANDAVFFGFRGVDHEGNDKVILEQAKYGDKDVAIDAWGLIPVWGQLLIKNLGT